MHKDALSGLAKVARLEAPDKELPVESLRKGARLEAHDTGRLLDTTMPEKDYINQLTRDTRNPKDTRMALKDSRLQSKSHDDAQRKLHDVSQRKSQDDVQRKSHEYVQWKLHDYAQRKLHDYTQWKSHDDAHGK